MEMNSATVDAAGSGDVQAQLSKDLAPVFDL